MYAHYNGIQPKFAAVVNPQQNISTPTHGAPVVIPLDAPEKDGKVKTEGDDAGQSKAITKSELPSILKEAEKTKTEERASVEKVGVECGVDQERGTSAERAENAKQQASPGHGADQERGPSAEKTESSEQRPSPEHEANSEQAADVMEVDKPAAENGPAPSSNVESI